MAKQNKLHQIQKLIDTAHVSLESARQLLVELAGKPEGDDTEVMDKAKEIGKESVEGEEKIIEGVFDGQNMIGPDGKQYSVPANYASKSKLVVGDTLKLTIKGDGTFLYKQIGPVERGRVVGILTKDETTDEYRVVGGDKSFRVLLASITYFKGEPGDEVVILVPKDREAEWAAVENIIKASEVAARNSAQAATNPAPAPETDTHVEDIDDLN